jgi:hypothetical protein
VALKDRGILHELVKFPWWVSKLLQRGRKDELTEKLARVFFRVHE